jgi:hypothetical protein
MRKLLLPTIAALTLACTTNATQAQREGGNYMGGYFGDRHISSNQNIGPVGPGGPCAINLKCGQNFRPLDPNAPTYAPKRKAKR